MFKFKWTLLLLLVLTPNLTYASKWLKLNSNPNSSLWLDQDSVTQQVPYEKAWLKIDYHAPQKNLETVEDKTYNNSKSLVYFDCSLQKTATTQVYQFNKQMLIYSAGVDIQNATFIEPAPESDIEIAMQKVCKTAEIRSKKEEAKKRAEAIALEKKQQAALTPKDTKKSEEESVETPKEPTPPAAKPTPKVDKKKEAEKAKSDKKTEKTNVNQWSYSGKEGPAHWADINEQYKMCSTGVNQSPINIDTTIHAALKPIKTIGKFLATEISNNGLTIQVNFGAGNMIGLDKKAFQLKYLQFHAPSENKINGKAFPLEAHFVHMDNKGSMVILAVMFNEGEENKALSKLWLQIPKEPGPATKLKARIRAEELWPIKRQYYRFNGSITTPPCTEGVKWVVLKAPVSISKSQISQFKETLKEDNNRPIQALNGRMVLE
jgi:carbonic anhydrase